MKTFNFQVKIETNEDVGANEVARLLNMLINVGLSDAQESVEEDEGNMDDAELATSLNIHAPTLIEQTSSVPVAYWDASLYGNQMGDREAGKDFQMIVADQRESNGQLYVDIAGNPENPDDLMSMTCEINKFPGNDKSAQCVHLHFDDDLAASFFKMGNKIVVRPETGVVIDFETITNNGFAERIWVISRTDHKT